MDKKELKEMSVEEFAEKLKADAIAELNTNVDEEEAVKETSNENKAQLDKDFSQFTRLVRRLKKTKAELKELAMLNKDNEELQRYIKLLAKVAEIELSLDEARKGYLYDSAILVPDYPLENKDVKVTVTMPYDKEDFNAKQFKDDFGPDTEMYQKYVTIKAVKGNIKYKVKE